MRIISTVFNAGHKIQTTCLQHTEHLKQNCTTCDALSRHTYPAYADGIPITSDTTPDEGKVHKHDEVCTRSYESSKPRITWLPNPTNYELKLMFSAHQNISTMMLAFERCSWTCAMFIFGTLNLPVTMCSTLFYAH